MKKIDIHMHCFKHRALPHTGTDNTFMTPEEVIALYDEMEVEQGILLPVVSPDCSNSVQGNEEVEEISRNSGGRLLWFCNVDPRNYSNSPDSDLSLIIGAYKKRGALGVGELVSNLPFDDPMMENLFFHCQKQQMPLLFHVAPERYGYYGIYDEIGLPRLEKALVKFPELMFIGHSQPFWAEISSDVTRENRNTYPLGKVTPGRVVELLRKYPNLYCDLSANSGFNAMKRDEEFGCGFLEEFQDRLFFGTDICTAAQRIGLSAWLDEKCAEGKISQEAYFKISRGNAEQLLLKKR